MQSETQTGTKPNAKRKCEKKTTTTTTAIREILNANGIQIKKADGNLIVKPS